MYFSVLLSVASVMKDLNIELKYISKCILGKLSQQYDLKKVNLN
jgi:hypothetical protein